MFTWTSHTERGMNMYITIRDLKRALEAMDENKTAFIALETKDENEIDVTYCYDIESISENAGNLQINIKE